MADIAKYDASASAVPSNVINTLRLLKNELLEIEDIVSVVLFGSCSRGNYGKNSDIDIAVFVRNSAAGKLLMIYRQAVRCAAKYNYDIQILIFTVQALDAPVGIVEEIVAFGQDISYI
ncbi:MAG: nucleotidyltransferase domain-containing protein [Eubacteriales bacterium]|jgi:DNA polymerase sigma